jgi:hypothetical protein
MITKGRACGTMRAMRHLAKLPCMAALAFLTGMGAFSACSSDDKTVVALTISSDDTIGIVDQILVTVTSDKPMVTKTVAPNKNPDSGVIAPSFFTRLELDGLSGTVTVKVDAMGPGGASIATASTEVELRDHGAVAARVNLTTKKPPADAGAPADGGADGGDAQTD